MATIRPQALAPPPPPPPATALPRAGIDADENGGDTESVAESYPSETVIDVESGGDDDDGGKEEEDGCCSCIDAGDQECDLGLEGSSEAEGKKGPVLLWRSHQYVELETAMDGGEQQHARRQEEDRKFWEACLASGYP